MRLLRPVAATLLAAAVALPFAAWGQGVGFADPARTTKLASTFADIDRVFTAYSEQQHIPGAVWGIVIDGKLAHVGVAGYRDLATKAPVDSGTVFRIASMTKSFTAAAIMKLRDDGKLSLDDPVEKWVPELKGLTYPTSDAPRLTVRHLLSHAAGFPEDNPWGDQQLAVPEEQFTKMLMSGIPFSNAPGVAYEYSNYGFAILGRVVTRASGMPYRTYIQNTILRPLGMTSTTLEPALVARSRVAQGYRWEDEQWKLEPQLPDGAFGAMGGMLTSTRDLAVWVAQFLDAWPPRDGAETGPVRRSSLRDMQQIHRPRPATASRLADGSVQISSGGYGFGLGISGNCNFAHVVAHSGGLPGFGSIMRWLPEYGVGIIAFGNRTYTGWGPPSDSAFAFMTRTGALEPRMPKPAQILEQRREQVTRLVLHWDDTLADSLAAVNLFLDEARDRRKAKFESFKTTLGPCRAGSGWELVENALRGQWIMPCERGPLRVTITLAPTTVPTVQFLDVVAIRPGSEGVRRRLCTL